MFLRKINVAVMLWLTGGWLAADGAVPGRVTLHGHVPAAVAGLAAKGRLPATNQLTLAIGLPLRNPAQLDELLRQLYDPASTNFHKFLTPPEFTARFGPTEADYAAVRQFAESNGLVVVGTHPNRVVLDVTAAAADIERAFGVTLRTYRHPTEARDFYAPDTEPSVPANLAVADMWGLSDYPTVRPMSRSIDALKIKPLGGSGPSGYYAGNDFRNAYVPGTPLTGTGQSVGLLEFSSYYPVDITNYENTIGMTNYVPLTTVLVGSRSPSASQNAEVALDIEMAIAMAPGLSRVIVYEEKSVAPSTILSRMANDNLARQLSSSWSWSGGPNTTIDNIFLQMATQGQSFFQASGDSDAYTGANLLDGVSQVNAPVDSPNITVVGGTTLTMSGSGASWSAETVWNYHYSGGVYANEGSSGGISRYYAIPWWQTNAGNLTLNQVSSNNRNIPDVALTADGIYVAYNNGSSGGMAGTSCAAPLWAGFAALANQQSAVAGGAAIGFVNPVLYALAAGTNYNACFHDITTGNNIGTNTPGSYYAFSNYDLCTGLGTPNGTNLINALAPQPGFLNQPASQTVASGAVVTFNPVVLGQPPLSFQWRFNGTNLVDDGNVSGSTGNGLSIAAVTTNQAGSFSLVVTNAYGAITSSVAVLTVGVAPVVTVPPASQSFWPGSNVVFAATVSGSTPLSFQWRKNGTNLANGTGISGATSNLLTLTAVTTNSVGAYSLYASNLFGVVTSSVATLTLALPPAITSSTLTNRLIQCARNTNLFSITTAGTLPLAIQWSLDGAAIAGATNTSFGSTNLAQNLPSHTVAVTVTNLYGSVMSNAFLIVTDTIPPVITLNGASRMTNELGSAFTDPGATASDACAGSVPVSVNGSVNLYAVGTNTLTYTANDGSGNTNAVTRIVVVRDTTPPVIASSFTNLVMAAVTNCHAIMPDVTGTNFIQASDLSGTVIFSQSPTNNAGLPLGTNIVVITAADASGNAVYSTNTIVVLDQTPPVVLTPPPSQTNWVGAAANFSVAATACTPLAFQWFFNNAALPAQTNNFLTLSPLTPAMAGKYFVIVSAAGGSSTSAVAVLTVELLPTTLALASSENPGGFRDSLNFTATVTPATATGAVQFFTNGVTFDSQPLVAGAAVSTNLAALSRGTNFIAAVYAGDANDLPATNTLLQIVTNHPPVATNVFYTGAAGSPLNIPVSELAAFWGDADGDTVSLAGIGVSTNGVTVTNNAGTLVYFNPNAVADQFVCTVTDGWGGTNFQTVNLEVVLPNIVSVVAGGGGMSLNLSGSPGATYVLETTAALFPADWQAVATNTLGPDGVWRFTDNQATNFPQRFYRLRLAP